MAKRKDTEPRHIQVYWKYDLPRYEGISCAALIETLTTMVDTAKAEDPQLTDVSIDFEVDTHNSYVEESYFQATWYRLETQGEIDARIQDKKDQAENRKKDIIADKKADVEKLKALAKKLNIDISGHVW
jgi:hypothetical protein